MRLYLKLLLMIFAAMMIQRHGLADGRGREIWFGLRCEIAYLTNDAWLLEQLIVEAHDFDFGGGRDANTASG